jgi:putative oxidoreductase
MLQEFGERFRGWVGTHRDIALDLIRMYVGVGLFVRGLLLVSDPRALTGYVERVDWLWAGFVTHYVVLAHVAGGFLLAAGFVTRLAAAVQIPALLGAVFIVHLGEGLLTSGQALELSALVLVLLCMFTLFGAGRLSIDHYVFAEDLIGPDSIEPRRRVTARRTLTV